MKAVHLQGSLLGSLALSMLLAACGGDVLQGGIDGTGFKPAATQPIAASGRITEFGSVQVNGVHYDTAAATFVVDGQPATQSALRIGDVIFVDGSIDPTTNRGTATRVTSDHVVRGEVASVDPAAGTFAVLGQTVVVSPETAFDGAFASLAGLRDGVPVDVAGFRDLEGRIVASRVDRQSSSSPRFRVLGAVSASEPAAFRLTMNGLTVDYARATLLPAGAILLFERGDFVDVKGAVDAATGLFVATSVEQRRKRLDGAVEGRADIEGLLTKIDSTDPTRFEVNGLPVSTTAATAFAGTLSTRSTVTVKGVVTSAGTVAASTVKAVPLPFGPPVPAAVSNNLRIRVRDAAGAPQGGTQVSLWVQSSSVGYSYAWATGANTTTDAAGNLLASTPEGANVSAYAARSGYQQPCVASTTISGSSVLDVQLVPAASLLASNSPAPFSTGGVVISGTVFETVAGARRPVPGALVWFESLSDLVSATTLTDLEGRYVLCRLPPQVSASELWVTKSGYADLEVWPIDTRQSGTRDLELTRVP